MQKALVISNIGNAKKEYKVLLYPLNFYQSAAAMIAKGELLFLNNSYHLSNEADYIRTIKGKGT